MQRNEKIARLFETACRVGKQLGIEVEEAAAGGCSDGCFCAALGVPVLDGLGAVGEGRTPRMSTSCSPACRSGRP